MSQACNSYHTCAHHTFALRTAAAYFAVASSAAAWTVAAYFAVASSVAARTAASTVAVDAVIAGGYLAGCPDE